MIPTITWGEIDHIGIAHEGTSHRNGAQTEEEETISRSELGKLIRIARIERPGATYDAPGAAQTFPAGKMMDILEEREDFPKMAKKKISRKSARVILSTYRAFHNFTRNKRMLTK